MFDQLSMRRFDETETLQNKKQLALRRKFVTFYPFAHGVIATIACLMCKIYRMFARLDSRTPLGKPQENLEHYQARNPRNILNQKRRDLVELSNCFFFCSSLFHCSPSATCYFYKHYLTAAQFIMRVYRYVYLNLLCFLRENICKSQF